MKKHLLLFSLLTITLIQCRTAPVKQLNESKLSSQYFEVDISKDTVLHTGKGALINIPKGAITGEGKVKLEIKEAYTIADMVLAGLSTKAGKDPLSSGGMIYINPVDGSAKITGKISVSIPTDVQRPGMQLYKGVRNPDSTVDWTDPQPLPPQDPDPGLQRGKVLFTYNCASCHNAIKDATGPPLAFLDKRRDWKWLRHFVYNSSELLANGDPLATCLFRKWNYTQMTAFPQISDTDLHLIFDYVDNEATNANASIPDFKRSYDSCVLYHEKRKQLDDKRNDLISSNETQAKLMMDTSGILKQGLPDNLVRPVEARAVNYKFTITEFGWHNVDILLKNLPGFEKSTLTVRIVGAYTTEMNIYLVIPQQKMLLAGGPVAGKTDEYAFFSDDGKIPLPQNTPAYILAMGEHDKQIYFGSTHFITTLDQHPEIDVSVTTKTEMNIQIQKMGFSDLSFTAGNSKNADSIIKIDMKLDELEKYKPQNCDCNCLGGNQDTGNIYNILSDDIRVIKRNKTK